VNLNFYKMKEVTVKNRRISFCVLGPPSGSWKYKIVLLRNKDTYRADLWGYNDDHGYLAQSVIQESSPEFATAEEAEAYAQKEWVIEL
jgi:hypothetical protein